MKHIYYLNNIKKKNLSLYCNILLYKSIFYFIDRYNREILVKYINIVFLNKKESQK